jgi:translation initiation factor IF-2
MSSPLPKTKPHKQPKGKTITAPKPAIPLPDTKKTDNTKPATAATPAPNKTPLTTPAPVPTPASATTAVTSTTPNTPPAPAAAQPRPTTTTTADAPPPQPDGPRRLRMKPPIIAKDLAAELGIKPYQLIHELMELNIFATMTQQLDTDIVRKICDRHKILFETEKKEPPPPPPAPQQTTPPPEQKPRQNILPRPPIITFMGHVDHGKTSLMDAIRQAQVALGEKGGITQHIGAYTLNWKGSPITFMDTPGHEAFSAMRARGAKVTDIVVLVVAADDGIMPQTLEALAHARAAGVKIIVAINKIDLPGADPEKVKKQLQQNGLTPEDWGGDTIVCEVSALKKTGIDKLMENILALAEIMELKADVACPASGTVIEAQLETGRGPTATLIIQQGTLHTGDAITCGDHWAKIKAMFDDKGRPLKTAGPSTPARVIGLSDVPLAGDPFQVVENDRIARQLSEEKLQAKRLGKLQTRTATTLENIFQSATDERKTLNLILKTDVQGSVEAITAALKKIPTTKVRLEIIYAAVGPITVSDVALAVASDAVIIGFNTKTESNAAAAAKRDNIQIKLYSIIYELLDQVQEAMAGLLDPITRENIIGTALVKQVFQLSKFRVAGCVVQSGRLARGARARVLRGKQPIYDGGFQTLKRIKDDVNEVRSGLECGVRLGNFDEYEVGDIIQCYTLEKIPQSLT